MLYTRRPERCHRCDICPVMFFEDQATAAVSLGGYSELPIHRLAWQAIVFLLIEQISSAIILNVPLGNRSRAVSAEVTGFSNSSGTLYCRHIVCVMVLLSCFRRMPAVLLWSCLKLLFLRRKQKCLLHRSIGIKSEQLSITNTC